MKRVYILFALMLLATYSNSQERITLMQCYELARTNYPLIQQYNLIDKSEQYNLSNVGKAWLPQLFVNAKATYQSDVTKLPIDLSNMPGLSGLSIPSPSKDQYQVVAQVNQTIWDGGIIHSTRALTRIQATANREQLESDLYTLNDRVNQLYFGSILQDELLQQNATLQKNLQINLDQIVARLNNGVANQSDRECIEVELLNAHQQEIILKAGRTAYRDMLATLIGKQITETTVLNTPTLSSSALSGVINRPELRALEAQSNLAEVRNKQITAGLMPRIGLFAQGGYGRPGLNMLEDKFSAFYLAGINLSWNFGSLYTLKNDRKKTETNRQMIDVQRDVFLFNTELQLMQQNKEIQKIAELIQSDDEIVRLRTSIKEAAEVKLKNGVISVTDLIREINAEDLAKQTGALHRIQKLLSIYNYMYTTNNY